MNRNSFILIGILLFLFFSNIGYAADENRYDTTVDITIWKEVSVRADWVAGPPFCQTGGWRTWGPNEFIPNSGWVIVDHEITVNPYRDAHHDFKQLEGGLHLISVEQLKKAYDAAKALAALKNDQSLVDKLEEEFTRRAHDIRNYSDKNKNKLMLKLSAKPSGDCFNQHSGSIDATVKVTLKYIGTPIAGIILQELITAYNLIE